MAKSHAKITVVCILCRTCSRTVYANTCAEEDAAKNGCKSDGQGAFVDACAGLGEAACVAVDTDGLHWTLDCTFGSALTTIGPNAFESSVRPSVFVGIHL